SRGPGSSDLAVLFGAEGSALAISDDCFGVAGGSGLAELAPATAALFSNLLSLVVRPAISEDGAAATATFFSNLSSLARTSADSKAGVCGGEAFFSSLSSLAAITANLDEDS